MVKDSNSGAAKYGALVGGGSGRSKGQDLVEEHCCSLMSHWGLRGLIYININFHTGKCLSLRQRVLVNVSGQ